MTRLWLLFVAGAFFIGHGSFSLCEAQPVSGAQPTKFLIEAKSISGRLMSLDIPLDRAVIEDVDGAKMMFRISDPAKQAEALKEGDPVRVVYLEPLVISIDDNRPGRLAGRFGVVEVNVSGAKPAKATASLMEVRGRIQAIDASKRTVTLVGRRRRILTVGVDKRVKRFDSLKQGDLVILTVTEQKALSIAKN